MSSFLQRLVERVQGPPEAPLRRRRPSLFEGREVAPPMPMVPDTGIAVLKPELSGSEPRVVHTREIYHHDSAAAPIARRAPRDEVVATPTPKLALPLPPALPTPPSLRPLPAAPAPAPAPALQTSMAASTEIPAPPIARHVRREADTALPATPAPRARPSTEAIDPPPLRRSRPGPAASTQPVPQVQALPLPPRLPLSQRAAMPVAHPARRAALPAPAETPVQVSIGSVEIRAQAAATTERARSRPSATALVPSLDAYLRQRHGGTR